VTSNYVKRCATRAWLGVILVALGGCLTEPEPDPRLSALSLSYGALDPTFAPNVTEYTVEVPFLVTNLRVTAVAAAPGASITVDGVAVTSGSESQPLDLAEGDTTIDIEVTAVDGVTTKTYAVTVARQDIAQFAQQAYVKASNTGASNLFGRSIAVSGDTLVVGAPHEASGATGIDGDQTDTSAGDSGAVYVFVRDGGSWIQQAYLKASNAEEEDNFGWSVAVEGDTLAVGSPLEDSSARGVNAGGEADNSTSSSGSVYVFVRTGSTWSQQAYIKASNTGSGDRFGAGVALSGDTLAVSAYAEKSSAAGVNGDQDNDGAEEAGAVYVFVRDEGVWSQQAYVKASNTQAGDAFGWSLDLSGDTLAVGAPFEDSSATGINGNQADAGASASGAVYVYAREGVRWVQQAYVKASNTGSGDWFGWSVTLDGDTLAVAAPTEDSSAVGIDGDQLDDSAVNAGAAYVFVRSGTTWSQQAYVKASNTQTSDEFGYSVALAGDALLVTAIREDGGGVGINTGNQLDNGLTDGGAAYLYTRAGSTWTQRAYLKPSNTGPADLFGHAAAIEGDTIVISAHNEDSGATGIDGDQADDSTLNAGAVYVFR